MSRALTFALGALVALELVGCCCGLASIGGVGGCDPDTFPARCTSDGYVRCHAEMGYGSTLATWIETGTCATGETCVEGEIGVGCALAPPTRCVTWDYAGRCDGRTTVTCSGAWSTGPGYEVRDYECPPERSCVVGTPPGESGSRAFCVLTTGTPCPITAIAATPDAPSGCVGTDLVYCERDVSGALVVSERRTCEELCSATENGAYCSYFADEPP